MHFLQNVIVVYKMLLLFTKCYCCLQNVIVYIYTCMYMFYVVLTHVGYRVRGDCSTQSGYVLRYQGERGHDTCIQTTYHNDLIRCTCTSM